MPGKVPITGSRSDAKLRKPRALTFGNRSITLDRLAVLLRVFRNLREMKIDDARLTVIRRLEIQKQAFRFRVILHLNRDRRDRVFEIARVAVAIP